MKILELQPGTEQYEDAIRGYVLAERINDCIAKPDSKRYQEYLRYVQDAFMGESPVDPKDRFRDRELVPRALDAYERRHEVTLETGRLYFADDFPIVAAPDAVDGELIGITVHIRQTMETYEAAIQRGVDNDMLRHAQAMMAITGLFYWLHLNYYENAETRIRRLHEHDVVLDRPRATELEQSLIQFAAKSRFAAADAMRMAG